MFGNFSLGREKMHNEKCGEKLFVGSGPEKFRADLMTLAVRKFDLFEIE